MEYSSGMLKKQFELAISVLKLNDTSIKAVASDKEATVFGVGFLVVPPVVSLILGAFIFPSGFGAIFSRFLSWSILIPPLSFVGSIFVMVLLVQKYFRLKMEFLPFFRVVGYAGFVSWLTILPFLLGVIGLVDAFSLLNLVWTVCLAWLFLVSFTYLERNSALNRQNMGITLIVGVLSYLVINAILGDFFVGNAYRIF